MPYRVAVVQNETELLRYSYADVRRLIRRQDYDWDYYTAENIESLGLKLSTYDGIVVATNACNDTKILNWLTNNSSEISTRLAAGDFGLLVNFQMALSDRRLDTGPFPFLDERYTLTGHKRLRDGEQADQGTFSRPQDLPIDPILNLSLIHI